jgi:DNA-binding FadR family transcriptional regulator
MAQPRPIEASTPAEAQFARLLRDIVSGAYAPGARLPAERDLAARLGCSRPTLRETLRRLSEWGLVEARRGSGVVVRPQRDWSIDVLPAYLFHAAPLSGPEEMGMLIRDMLAVRKAVFVEIVRIVGPRLKPRALDAARAHVEAAWAAKDDVATFVREDFETLRALVEAAGFLPALWLLNGLSGVYDEIATKLTGVAMAPPDYLSTYRTVFDALEAGRPRAACLAMNAYLERHDRRMLSALGIEP